MIAEHYRLGSRYAILSRSFCNANITADLDVIKTTFSIGVKRIRDYELFCSKAEKTFFDENKKQVALRVADVVRRLS